MSNPKTDKQRAAVHVWFRQCAEMLNEAGIDKTVVIEKLATRGIDMLWTPEAFKADIYKPVYTRVHDQQSTEQASTTDHDIVYHGLIKWFGQEFGIVLPPWPREEDRHGD